MNEQNQQNAIKKIMHGIYLLKCGYGGCCCCCCCCLELISFRRRKPQRFAHLCIVNDAQRGKTHVNCLRTYFAEETAKNTRGNAIQRLICRYYMYLQRFKHIVGSRHSYANKISCNQRKKRRNLTQTDKCEDPEPN